MITRKKLIWLPKYYLEIILLVAQFGSMQAEYSCFGGSTTFIRTTGVALTLPHGSVLMQKGSHPNTPDCITLCKQSSKCTAFTVDYQSGQCEAFGKEASEKADIFRPQWAITLYQKTCFRGVSNFESLCRGKKWSFERVSGAWLQSLAEREINMTSLDECARQCLSEENFPCRSASFDATIGRCRLSRETRYSLPRAFIINAGPSKSYLENQCIDTLSHCRFEPKDGVTMISVEDVKYASNYLDCERTCGQTDAFLCKSCAFDQTQNKCFLSAAGLGPALPDTPSLPAASGLRFSERNCPEDECAGGIYTFVKISSSTLRNANPQSLNINRLPGDGITEECLRMCKSMGLSCPAVIVDYTHGNCFKLDRNTQGRESDLIPSRTQAYFERLCVRNIPRACRDRGWQFERVMGNALNVPKKKVIQYVQSLRACSEACLLEQGFPCRSSEYDALALECRLSDTDRRLQPKAFQPSTQRIDYIENLCVSDVSCTFRRVIDAFPALVDVRLREVKSEDACKHMCSVHPTFLCRSIGFKPDSKECSLSSSDTTSAPDGSSQPIRGAVYLEKTCSPGMIPLPADDPIGYPSDRVDIMVPPPHPFHGGFPGTPGFPPPVPLRPPMSPPIPQTGFGSPSDIGSQGPPVLIGSQDTFSTITPTALPSSYIGGRCPEGFRGETQYQKVTGYQVLSSSNDLLYTNETRGITEMCRQLCEANDCHGFNLDYMNSRCMALHKINDIQGRRHIIPALATSYFEPICLTYSSGCNKLWAFESFPDRKFQGHINDVIKGISRAECRQRCISETRFPCRSANYQMSTSECWLNSASHTKIPSALIEAPGVEYLENQCVDRIVARQANIHPCNFGNSVRDKVLVFADKTVTVNTEADCQRLCNEEKLFNCRSYSYYPSQQTREFFCSLSADTQKSVGAQMNNYNGAVYAERSCFENLSPIVSTSTVTPFPWASARPSRPDGRPSFPFPIPGTGVNPFPSGPAPPPPFVGPLPFPQGMPGPQMPNAPRCFFPDDFTFEKTMGMAPRPMGFFARAEDLRLSGPQSIGPDCVRECTARDTRCWSFVIQYPLNSMAACVGFDRPVGTQRLLLEARQDTAYLEKICLRGRKCGKLWTFERVVGYAIDGNDYKQIQGVPTKEDCEDYCLAETTFECRSAEYVYSTQLCTLSQETRRSRPEAFRYVGPDVDYLENQCASEPVQCEYTEIPAKLLPYTDRFIGNLQDVSQCKELCEREREFLCRSFTWTWSQDTVLECMLSADDRFSTVMGVNAVSDRQGALYSEKGNCGQVRVDCTPNEIMVTVYFGSPFSGRIYAKGNPQLCTMPGAEQTRLTLPVPLGLQCGTVQEAPGRYANEIVVQQHPMIMTEMDKTYRVVCSFDATDKVITMPSSGRFDGMGGGIDVVNTNGHQAQIIQNRAPTPDVRMRITSMTGQDVMTVGIGDQLLFRIEPDPIGAFGIFAKNLIAKSEFNDYLPLLDGNGCPTDYNVFPALVPEPGTKALITPFRAFRFPSTGRVNFEVQVSFCQDVCPPLRCYNGEMTMGRKKRSPVDSQILNETAEDLVHERSQLNARSQGYAELSPQGASYPIPAVQNNPQPSFPSQDSLPAPITIMGTVGGSSRVTNQQMPSGGSTTYLTNQQSYPGGGSTFSVNHQPPLFASGQPQNPYMNSGSDPSFKVGSQGSFSSGMFSVSSGGSQNPRPIQVSSSADRPSHSSQEASQNPSFSSNPYQAPPMSPPITSFYQMGQTYPQSYNPYPGMSDSSWGQQQQAPGGTYNSNVWGWSVPTEIRLPPAAYFPVPTASTPQTVILNATNMGTHRSRSSNRKRNNTTRPQEMPLRLSLTVNEMEDDRNSQMQPNKAIPKRNSNLPPMQGAPPTRNPNFAQHSIFVTPITKAKDPVVKDPVPARADSVCAEKSTVIAAVVSTITIHVILVCLGVYVYKRRRRKRRRKMMANLPPNPVPQSVVYGPPSLAFRQGGPYGRFPSPRNTMRLTNWIHHQQRRGPQDPNRINIMEMGS